jgi:thermitase
VRRRSGYGDSSLTARKLIGVLVLGLALAAPPAAGAELRRHDADQRFVPGEALVRYERGTGASERREIRGAAGVGFETSSSLSRAQLVSVRGSVRDAVERLESQPGVAYAQPNFVYHALAPVPDDTHFGRLWGLGATPGVGVLPAWDRSRGAGQVIAIVDTGVDLTHPDLAGHLWTGPGGIHGHDFVDTDSDPDDFNLHGTHVAGTAAAIAGNGQGVAGVAPDAQIMAVRVLDGDGGGDSLGIANGILFAATNGAGVINLSLGGPAGPGDQAMQDAVAQAELRNVVVVAAAGNEANNNDVNPSTPCTLPNGNLICVAAVERTGARSDFSNFGATTVDVGAPGGDGSGNPDFDILSAKPSWAAAFSEDFEGAFPGVWTPSHTSGVDWGLANLSGGGHAVTDSPPGGTAYQPNTRSMLQTTNALDLTGRRGCRLDYLLGVDIDDIVGNTFFDFVTIGVVSGAGELADDFAGNTNFQFERIETSISAVDGRNDVKPTFRFTSDSDIEDDGAYVDKFNLLCRGNSYDNEIGADNAAAGHSYTAIAGTSMAAPHVAGVAALVRAVDPGATASQVVQALRNGAKPVAGLAGVTVTGGAVDAVGAMDAALALPNAQPQPQPQPQPPAKPRISRVRFIARRGIVSMLVRGDAGTSGVATLRANITTAARVRRVGRKTFAIGSTGRKTVRIKLTRRALKQLRRTRRLRMRAKVTLRNAAGLSSSTSARITIRLRRR